MARYIKEFQVATTPDTIFNTVYQYLLSEGYEYIRYENENVFQKGKGIWTGPTFIKLSFSKSAVRLEAWMKYALLPGVYVGEMGLTGFVGAAVKGPLKRRVSQIEAMIMQCANYDFSTQPQVPQQPACAVQTAANQPYFFCTNCGTKLAQGTAFCPNCGKATDAAQHTQTPSQQ